MICIAEGELFLIPLKFHCSVRYGSTVDMVLSAIICGHSFCKRLQVDRQAGTDARMRPSFKLEETARVRMLGKGGKTIGDFVRRDISIIQRYWPDILILLLGDNDIGCDTNAEEIAIHLIALASQLYMGGHVSRIVLRQMMPRSRAPRGCATQDVGSDPQECRHIFIIVRATGTGGQSSAKRSSKFVSFFNFLGPEKKSFVSSKTGRAKKASRRNTFWFRAGSTISTNRCAVRFCVLTGVLHGKRSNWGTNQMKQTRVVSHIHFPSSIYGRRSAARQVQANHLCFCFVLIVLFFLIGISPCDTSCNRHVSMVCS